ncbi:MAG: hypothetical protein HRT90_06115 [Candidatus Margulisbacteria bacterium]|nr:hypothetical protein [Candidatus Margulisiibacteriota bacterium]
MPSINIFSRSTSSRLKRPLLEESKSDDVSDASVKKHMKAYLDGRKADGGKVFLKRRIHKSYFEDLNMIISEKTDLLINVLTDYKSSSMTFLYRRDRLVELLGIKKTLIGTVNDRLKELYISGFKTAETIHDKEVVIEEMENLNSSAQINYAHSCVNDFILFLMKGGEAIKLRHYPGLQTGRNNNEYSQKTVEEHLDLTFNHYKRKGKVKGFLERDEIDRLPDLTGVYPKSQVTLFKTENKEYSWIF